MFLNYLRTEPFVLFSCRMSQSPLCDRN